MDEQSQDYQLETIYKKLCADTKCRPEGLPGKMEDRRVVEESGGSVLAAWRDTVICVYDL